MKDNFLKILKGSLVSIAITLVLVLIASALLTFSNIPETVIPVMIIIISAISILIGSIMSTSYIDSKGMINGASVGLIYIVVIYLLSSIMVAGFNINIKSLIMMFVSVIAGMIGGIVGVNLHKNN